jgi:hypothetical protein
MKLHHLLSLSAVAAIAVCLTSCGGSSSTPPPTPPAISVALSSPPTTLVASVTASLTATVTNDSANAGVKWTVSCTGSACGSFNPTSTASGVATTYTAPSAVPSPATVTITATSATDATKSATATITITAPAPPAISVTLTPQPPTSLVTGATASLTAVVTNDSKGVNWTVTCGTSPCGSFNPTGTASGAPTTYTAPTAIPTPNTVTVTATSVTDPTKSASATITIGTAPPIFADGTYIFHLSGQDGTTDSSPYFVTGAFTIKGGVITGGEQDFTDFSNISTDPLVPSGSSITQPSGGNIQIVLATANPGIGVGGIETLRGTAVSSSRILISEFDTRAAATGSIDLQTSAATPSGGYAFALSGMDTSTNPQMLVVGGILNFNAGNLVVNGSVLDYNDGGGVGQGEIFTSGTVTAPDSFGRVTFTFTLPTTAFPNFVLTGYVVGPNQIQLVESQNTPLDVLGADLGGVALGQGNNVGKFTQASIANTTYLNASSGEDSNGLVTLIGQFSFSSAGAVSGQIALNDGTNFGAGNLMGGATYIVDPTGRVTLQGVAISTQLPTMAFQLYLDGNGNALALGIDGFQFTQGLSYQQTSPALTDFEGSFAISGQGFLASSNGAVAWGAVGPVTVNSDAFNGFTDYGVQGFTPNANVALTGTETDSTGYLSLMGLNGGNFTAAYSYDYFTIDSRRVLAIENDGQQLGLLLLEGVSH